MEKFKTRLSATNCEDSKRVGLAFSPEPTDVFITTYPKCGTTWVSMILHSLRSKGDLNFGEITEVVPWTINAQLCGQVLTDPQRFSPRLFKSHENYNDVPKGGKYVYVVRNPDAVVLSFYEFLLSVAGMTADELSFEEFYYDFFTVREGTIWSHYLSFIAQRNNPHVLWLFYEDLLLDRKRCVEKLAEFAGITMDASLLATVMEQSSFDFMKAHATKFDDHFLLGRCFEKANQGLLEDDPNRRQLSDMKANKVHRGTRSTTGLPTDIRADMQQKWNEVIGASTGFPNYEALRNELSFVRQVPTDAAVAGTGTV